ncbi:unnamed protein product [Prunus armeniaca]
MESLLEVSHKPLSMGVGPLTLYRKKRGAMRAPCLMGSLGWSPEAQERGQSWYLRHVGAQLKWSTCLGIAYETKPTWEATILEKAHKANDGINTIDACYKSKRPNCIRPGKSLECTRLRPDYNEGHWINRRAGENWDKVVQSGR